MFSKNRKQLNIMLILLILLTVLIGAVFVSIISIDQYCEENVIENIQSEEKITVKEFASLARNISITIDAIEVTLRYEADVLTALQTSLDSENTAVKGTGFDNCLAVISNNFYNIKSEVQTADVEYRKFDWYQGAIKQKDGTLYVSSPYRDEYDGDEYIAFSKYVKNGGYVIAICMTKENIQQKLASKVDGQAYLINVNGEIIASKTGKNEGTNIKTEANLLPLGYDEVFNKIDRIGKQQVVDTKAGQLYTSKHSVISGLHYIVIRDNNALDNKVSSAYLKVIITVILIIPILFGLLFFGNKYVKRVQEIYINKCSFIESLALEMKIPLETINMTSYDIKEYINDEQVNRQLDIILESTKAIAFDLNSAFDYSKLGLNELKIDNSTYSFNKILNNVEKVVHSDVQKNNIYFEAILEGNGDLKLYGDQRKMEEIIINTVKYCASQTIEGGIELKVMYADLTPEKVNIMLIIKDSGVGMNDVELPLFTEGLKARHDTIEVEHSGIGLEMVKQLVRILKGKIIVDSTKNVGSVFTIMIPQKIVIGDDSKWENEYVGTSTELLLLYSKIGKTENDYGYIASNKSKTSNLKMGMAKKNDLINSERTNQINLQNESIRQEKSSIQGRTNDVNEEEVLGTNMSNVSIKSQNSNELNKQKIRKQEKKNYQDVTNKKENDKTNNLKITNTLFSKKVTRLEDMIPSPEIIDEPLESQNNELNDSSVGELELEGDYFGEGYEESDESASIEFTTENNLDEDSFVPSDEYNHVEYQPGGYIPPAPAQNDIQVNTSYNQQQQELNNVQTDKDYDTLQQKENRTSVTQYLDDSDISPIDVQKNEEEDLLQKQMREQMENQSKLLFAHMANNEVNRIRDNIEQSLENSYSVNETKQEENSYGVNEEQQEDFIIQEETDDRVELLNRFLGQFGIDVELLISEFITIDSYEKTLIEFYDYSKNNANKIINMWNQKQFNEYLSSIDTIKAGASAIGATKLVEMLEIQISKGGEGDLKYVAQSIKETFGYWKQLLAAIAQYENAKAQI